MRKEVIFRNDYVNCGCKIFVFPLGYLTKQNYLEARFDSENKELMGELCLRIMSLW